MVRVCLLISSHALPLFSYRVPPGLKARVEVGSVVVAPLSGYSRFGVVVGFDENHDRGTEEIRAVHPELSLPPGLIEVCRAVRDLSVLPLSSVLRAAMPPGLNTSTYRVLDPAPEWPWKSGALLSRTALRRALGNDLRVAEAEGRLDLVPKLPCPPRIEWAMLAPAMVPDLSRAPRQRELYEFLKDQGGEMSVPGLLTGTGARRAALRELVGRGAVLLEERDEPYSVLDTTGRASETGVMDHQLSGIGDGGTWLWRTPTADHAGAVSAACRETLASGRRVLVLAPEISSVEDIARRLRSELPDGYRVAAYHSGLGRERASFYALIRRGDVDVVVGTRTAALLPVPDLGLVCVVDEPNESHRADPGYEGLPLHVRDVALRRGKVEGTGVLFLSPTPSLRLYASGQGIRELPARSHRRWPTVRIVDLRGSGAALTSTLVGACRRSLGEGKSVGVVVNRLGYATAVACNRCGEVDSCPSCDVPLSFSARTNELFCPRCTFRDEAVSICRACGSGRLNPTGLTVERVRTDLAKVLDEPIGLLTGEDTDLPDARIVVGTAHRTLSREWDTVIVPDADGMLLGSGMGVVERGFRLLFRAAESARQRLFVQTRVPEHYALQAALRGDYPAFASAELPRLRSLGYPPFAHLADVAFEGAEKAARRAVESALRPALNAEVRMSGLVPLTLPQGPPAWRVLVRGRERASVTRIGEMAARLAANTHGDGGLKVKVNIDPEEV